MPEIPSGPEAVTPEWLTEALRSGGAVGAAVVGSFDLEPLGEGQGFTGRLARLRLRYAVDEPGAPRTLVVKFPSADRERRGRLLEVYRKELRFYREVARDAGLRTPRLYFGALDDSTMNSVLLIEDLGYARPGDNLAGCSRADAERVVRDLATFQAGWWEGPRLGTVDWLPAVDADADALEGRYQAAWKRFTRHFGRALPDAVAEAGPSLCRNVAWLRRRLALPPRTIVHSDFRLDNLFFDDRDGGIVVIDWQGAMRGRGAFDAAYFLVLGLPVEERRAAETELLGAYHAALRGHGVTGYAFEELLEDYRLSIAQLLVYLVLVGRGVSRRNERGEAFVQAFLERTTAALGDHDAASLLPRSGLRGLLGRLSGSSPSRSR